MLSRFKTLRGWVLVSVILAGAAGPSAATSDSLRTAVENAVRIVKPALVRIHVVETYYSDGRELKYEASGSGVVITGEGHVITNHHVVGHAKLLKCTFANKAEFEAELVGSDPLTDIAVIKLKAETDRAFPVAPFGDSSRVKVGDHILAMGSPLALSQSVTLGIISNIEMIMPAGIRRRGGIRQDGEDVGALVRWLGHDAAIFPGNSGGPLVNLAGEIVGINEIGVGLSGAIPGNLAKTIAEQLIADGKVRRAWLGVEIQPRLRHDGGDAGILVSGVIKGSAAEAAGLLSGDHLLRVGEHEIDVEFEEQMPEFNRLIAGLPIGREVSLEVKRGEELLTLSISPTEREPREPKQYELMQWGLTVRNISFMLAKELKRDSTDGVLVTSVRPGGAAGSAKPVIQRNDVITHVGAKRTRNVQKLRKITEALTSDASEPVPTLVEFDRKTGKYLTVVEVGLTELEDPGLEVKKAWLPVQTQVLTRDIAELLDSMDLSGFRIIHVYTGSAAEKAGLEVGDLILAVDGEKMTASRPEHYEELDALIRQYRPGSTVELTIQRDGQSLTVPAELVLAPKLAREMKKYRDDHFEFTVRDITFFDRAAEQWTDEQEGVLVDQVRPGGWAALGELSKNDLLLEVDGRAVLDVAIAKEVMREVARTRPEALVFKVLRGIHTVFIELEPKWESS